ncbi:MAG: single-stranded DNA-binding protein [Phycisphaerae bacterium]|nr:single-stranded DNA-binding protein [Phycisphaerae bacterium]
MPNDADPAVTRKLVRIARELSSTVDALSFADPVEVVYNPLDYAWKSHRRYLGMAHRGIDALLLGMNPGPWGMAQTGVPFGEVAHVRDFLGIDEPVKKPEIEHPKRPIEGFSCTRSEVSGRRLWSWVSEHFDGPEAFFERFFIWNDCPLAFLEDSGRNRTPDKLPVEERVPLFDACDRSLRAIVKTLEPRMVIGVGAHATRRLKDCLGDLIADEEELSGLKVGTVLHPSPASPAANRDWAGTATRQMAALGLLSS